MMKNVHGSIRRLYMDAIREIVFSAISGIISGIILMWFQYKGLFTDKKQTGAVINNNVIEYHITEFNKVNTNSNNNNTGNGETISGSLVLLILLLGIVFYIEYSYAIFFVFLFLTFLIETMAISISLICKKRRIRFTPKYNLLKNFAVVATLFVPILIYISIVFARNKGIDVFLIKEQVNTEGFVILFKNIYSIGFLLYQVAGFLFLILFCLLLMMINLYLISLVKYNINQELKGIWKYVNRKYSKLCSVPPKTIVIVLVFLMGSFLMVSGIMIDAIISISSLMTK